MSSGYKAVIFDIDGTLMDNTHRLHFISGQRKDWQAYNANMGLDEPIEPICAMARTLAWHYKLVFMTGRPESYRMETVVQLKSQSLVHEPLMLFMRKDDDRRGSTVIKREWLTQLLATGRLDPILVVEDRAKVVAMWRAAGLICLQCAGGNY